jgi:hypothetical protein
MMVAQWLSDMWPWLVLPIGIMVIIFFVRLLMTLIGHRMGMFTKKLGRRHQLTGAFYLSWLILGFIRAFRWTPITNNDMSDNDNDGSNGNSINWFLYDTILGVAGTLLSLTAAFDFRAHHSSVKNMASGSLDPHATITYDEMMEHSFYQGLNLIQIWLLHTLQMDQSLPNRAILCILATSPWLIRHKFPVHPFSANYIKVGLSSTSLKSTHLICVDGTD